MTYVNGLGCLGCRGDCSSCPGGGMAGLGLLSGDTAGVTIEAAVKNSDAFRRFNAGDSGTYDIGFRVEGVQLNQKKTTYFDKATWQRAMRQAGATNVEVTNVRFVGSTDPRTKNWADDAFKYVTGRDADPDNLVADIHYVVTINVEGAGEGVGAWPGWVVGVVVLGALAATIALIDGLTGHNIIVETLEAIARGLFKVTAAAGGGALLIIGALALGAMLLRKSGGKISTKWFSGG